MKRPYTQQEVFRTAHPYIESRGYSFGDGLQHGINEVCICCKTPAHGVSSDEILEPFKRFYKESEWKAYECGACGYMFSWYRKKAQ